MFRGFMRSSLGAIPAKHEAAFRESPANNRLKSRARMRNVKAGRSPSGILVNQKMMEKTALARGNDARRNPIRDAVQAIAVSNP